MFKSTVEDIKGKFREGNTIIKLIIANVAVHIFLALVLVFLFLLGQGQGFSLFVHEWLCFPADILKIPFRLWTIITYMFLHNGLGHIFFNMLTLYIFGIHLNDWIDRRHIFPIYFWGGIAGALFFTIGFNLFPVFEAYKEQSLLGASASVMAIVLAAATERPKASFHIPFVNYSIELRWIALAWIILNLIVIPSDNPGGALAHLGGAFMGWFYITQLHKGRDFSEPIYKVWDWFKFKRKKKKGTQSFTATKPKDPIKKAKKPQFKATMNIYKGGQRSDYYGNEYSHLFIQQYKDMSREECLNAILEKIKRSGYDGLSEDEKVFLNRYK